DTVRLAVKLSCWSTGLPLTDVRLAGRLGRRNHVGRSAGAASGLFSLLLGVFVWVVGQGSGTAWAGPPAAPQDAEGMDFFEKKVRPLLADHCYRCHSHRATKLRGRPRLDTREGVLKGGNSGRAVVPGDPERSLLIRAVRHADPDLKMPPGKRLSAEEVAALEAWVKRGAPVPIASRPTSATSASG